MATKAAFKLNTGAIVPGLGLGTWQSAPGKVEVAVRQALQKGYRHIDTAFAYQNEKEVGKGLRDSGVPREEIFLTTKLTNDHHHKVQEAIQESLSNLGVDYVDLYLIHWPASIDPKDNKKVLENWDIVKTWAEMQKVLESGKAKAIGVSNFQIAHLEKLLSAPTTKVTPAVNQIELHPYNPSPKLVAYCRSKGIHVTAYSPLGSTDSPLQDEPAVKELAEKYGKTVSQILLAWGLAKGWSVIPKSVTESRVYENFGALEVELQKEDVEKLSALKKRFRVCADSWLPIRVFDGSEE